MNKTRETFEELKNRGYDVEIKTISKNNGIKEGILLREAGSTCCPVIYEDHLTGIDAQENADIALKIFEATKNGLMGYEEFLTKEFALNNATICICKKDWNKELLANVVNKDIPETDLVIYIKCINDSGYGIKVTEDYLGQIGLTFDELLSAGIKNGEYSSRNINEVMAEMMEVDPSMLPPLEMDVVTNKRGLFGAAGILDPGLLKSVMDKYNAKKLFVIPSSVHEVLCVPVKESITPEFLAGTINEVNNGVVALEDRLSDHPYIFDGEKLENIGVEEPIDLDLLFA